MELFHQRHAQSLRDAAFDLALDQHGIDGAPDIMRGGDLQNFDLAQFDVDLDLGQMRAEAIDRIRIALAVLVERRRRRIEGLLRRDHIAMIVGLQARKIDFVLHRAVIDGRTRGIEA